MSGWTRFSRSDMQAMLVTLVEAMGLEHRVEGEILWTRDEDYFVVSSLQEAVREWAVGPHHCFRGSGGKSPEVYARYQAYMAEHGIPCVEQHGSEGRWFVLRKQDDPYMWRIE